MRPNCAFENGRAKDRRAEAAGEPRGRSALLRVAQHAIFDA